MTAVSAIKTEPSVTSDTPAPIAFTIHLPQVGGVTSASTTMTSGPTPLVTVASTSAAPTSSTTTKPTTSAATVSVGPGAIKGGINPLAASTGPKDASKEKKAFTFGSSLAGLADNDINDVAAMGGVNLAEESQRILGSTDMIGTQIRSCKDENFLFTGPLQRRIQQIGILHFCFLLSIDQSLIIIIFSLKERFRRSQSGSSFAYISCHSRTIENDIGKTCRHRRASNGSCQN
jgi:transcription initiation factor TFIID subunit 4